MTFTLTKTFDELTGTDIELLDTDQLKKYAIEASRIIHREPVTSVSTGSDADYNDDLLSYIDDNIDDFNDNIKLRDLAANKIRKKTDGTNHLGLKLGKTSQYHYTFYSNGLNQYVSAILIKGKKHHILNSHSEIECALAIDHFLDEIEDNGRPRNRNEFPEIMDAYLEKAEHNEE